MAARLTLAGLAGRARDLQNALGLAEALADAATVASRSGAVRDALGHGVRAEDASRLAEVAEAAAADAAEQFGREAEAAASTANGRAELRHRDALADLRRFAATAAAVVAAARDAVAVNAALAEADLEWPGGEAYTEGVLRDAGEATGAAFALAEAAGEAAAKLLADATAAAGEAFAAPPGAALRLAAAEPISALRALAALYGEGERPTEPDRRALAADLRLLADRLAPDPDPDPEAGVEAAEAAALATDLRALAERPEFAPGSAELRALARRASAVATDLHRAARPRP